MRHPKKKHESTTHLANLHGKLKRRFKKNGHFFKIKKDYECFGIKHANQRAVLYDSAVICDLSNITMTESSLLFFSSYSDSFAKHYLPTKSKSMLEELQQLYQELFAGSWWSRVMTTQIFALNITSAESLERQISHAFPPMLTDASYFPQQIPHHLLMRYFHQLVTPLTQPADVCEGNTCNHSCRRAYHRLFQKFHLNGKFRRVLDVQYVWRPNRSR